MLDSDNLTHPVDTSDLKKGGFVVIDAGGKGSVAQPYKILELTTAAPGKHGPSKAIVTCLHLFTGKKKIHTFTDDRVDVPNMVRTEHLIEQDMVDDENIYIGDETYKFPKGDLGEDILRSFAKKKKVYIIITECMGQIGITGYKVKKN